MAYRILGSPSDADDAVQEAWLRFSRSDTSGVDNLGSWRARVQQQDGTRQADRLRQSALVDAFLAAARNGDFDALLAVLDPNVVLRADGHAVKFGAAKETRGAQEVAAFSCYARGARRALLDGAAAAVWMPGGRLRVVWDFTTTADRITAIDLIADPERLRSINLVILDDQRNSTAEAPRTSRK